MEITTNPSPVMRPPSAGSASASSSPGHNGNSDATANNLGQVIPGSMSANNDTGASPGVGSGMPYSQSYQQQMSMPSSTSGGSDQATMMQAQLRQARMHNTNITGTGNASAMHEQLLASLKAQRQLQKQLQEQMSASPSAGSGASVSMSSYNHGTSAPMSAAAASTSPMAPASSASTGNTSTTDGQSEEVIARSDVRPSDVLFGRGAGVSEHVGNVQFRHLIAQRKVRYRDAANHKIKNDVAREVVDIVQGRDVRPIGADGNVIEADLVERGWNPPGRFLRSADEVKAGAARTKKDKGNEKMAQKKTGEDRSNVWAEVTDTRAHEKCKQALRQHKWDAVSERATRGATVGGSGKAKAKKVAVKIEKPRARSRQEMENAASADTKIDGGLETPSQGSFLPESTVMALEAMDFSEDQPFDAASLSDGDLDFGDSGVELRLNDMPEPAPIAVPSTGVHGSFPQRQAASNTGAVESTMAAFEPTPLLPTAGSNAHACASHSLTAMELARQSFQQQPSPDPRRDNTSDDPDHLDPAYLRFLMPVIGEGETILDSSSNTLQDTPASLSLPEKVILAKRLAQRLREEHEHGSCAGYQGLSGIARQFGITINSKVPRQLLPDSNRTDLTYLGVIFHELFSGQEILAQSSSSFLESKSPTEEEDDASHMSQRSSKRERLKRDSSISAISAEESIDQAAWITATPLHEYGLPVSLSVLVSSLLCASDTSATERYSSIDECEIDLRMMESSPHRYLYDASPEAPTGTLQIPAALYGRDRHEIMLKSAVSRISNPSNLTREVFLLSGLLGAGKSSLAEKVGSSVADRGGYFVSGKFDQNSSIAVLCGAFDLYCQELVRRNDGHLSRVRTSLVQALGPDCIALSQLIPNVALITGQTSIGNTTGAIFANGGDLLAQLIFYLRTFVRIICSPDHPLVVYLDDMHCIDQASLQLVEMLVTDTGIKSLLLLGCYRSDEVMDDHPLKTQMASIQEAGVNVTTLSLQNMDRSSVNDLLSDTLRLAPRITRSLANAIHSKTSGNPLFVTQFIRSLVDEKLLTWSAERRRWVWDTPTIQAKNIDDTVVGLMTAKMLRLSVDVQKGLLIAACIGYQLDSSVLEILEREMDSFDGMSFLEIMGIAEKEGLLSTVRSSSYQFSHGAIHSAAYNLKTDGRDSLHLKIGRLFLEKASPTELETESVLLATVDQLNRSSAQNMTPKEKIRTAELNLIAGERAIFSSCHHAALLYFKLGLTYLDAQDWSGENYQFCLRLYNLSMETALAIGSFDDMETIIETILQKAHTYHDKLRAYYTRMCSLGAQGESPKAIEVGLDVLRKLDEEFPADITEDAVKVDLKKTKILLKGVDAEAISALEEMKDQQKIQAMRFLNRMGMIAYVMASKRLLPLIAFRIVRLSLTYGVCKESPFGIAVYSLILAGFLGDAPGASRFGKLALKLADKFQARDQLARISFVLYGFVFIWTEPIQACISKNFDAIEIGLKAGDSEYAMKCAVQALKNSAQTGEKLPTLSAKFQQYTTEMLQNKQFMAYKQCLPIWQGILNLMGQSENPLVLTGTACNEESLIFDLLDFGNLNACRSVYVVKLWLCVIFGDLGQAQIILNEHLGSLAKGTVAGLGLSFASFNMSVVYFSLARKGGNEKDDCKNNALAGLELFKTFASNSPWNFQHHYELLCAENNFLNGDYTSAAKTYEESILTAERHGFIHDAALFSERAGLLYYTMENKTRSTAAFRKARELYRKWGATRKADDLDSLC